MACLRRKWRLKFLLLCVGFLLFTTIWTFLTLLIVASQESLQNSARESQERSTDDYIGRGVQVIVGHYNGRLPDEKKENISEEEFNQNNYNPQLDAGQSGRAVIVDPALDRIQRHLFKINQFNLLASDMIPLNRSLPDVRKRPCRSKTYPISLPTTSVIIVFHNEAFSTLLRTVTSVINRSPTDKLKEIILVDDDSEREFLGEYLEKYVAQLSVPVRILRAPQREGLIRARLQGARAAKGDVLTFLDSHCECTTGWLEPLLARIAENRKAVVCPVIDVINDKTFAYQRGIEMFRGAFNWNLQFRWYAVPSEMAKARAKHPIAPILSPTMAGGLFSIDRSYFEEIGSYDPMMDIWGGENLEMSFRIWQCGGQVEILPCSHVGHVFRKASPHDFPDKNSGKVLNSNLVRVAEVWMDEFKYLFYKTAPQAADLSKSIDVSERLALKRDLGCKNFKWYLDNVWTDHFLPLEGEFFGRVQNLGTRTCITDIPGNPSKRQHTLCIKQCTLGFDLWQLWIFTLTGALKTDEHQCLTGQEISNTWIVQLKECSKNEKEFWDYNKSKQQLVHRKSKLCLDKPTHLGSDETKTPTLKKCARDASSQRWSFTPVAWKPT